MSNRPDSSALVSDSQSEQPSDPSIRGSFGRKVWTVGTLSYTKWGIVVLFSLLLFGDFSWSMRERSVGPMAQWYLSQINVPNLLFGILMTSFPALVGLVLTPIVSVKSDRYRSRWGRRIPFLLLTTPIAAISMIGIAVTPYITRWMHTRFPEQEEWVIGVVCFGLFWAAFEFATYAGGSVFNGLINDVVPASLLGRFYGLFRAVSLIDGIVFNYYLMGKMPEHFTLMLTVIGIFYGISFCWVCLKVKEGDYPPPPAHSPSSGGGVGRYFRECFTHSYYILIYLFMTLVLLSSLAVNTFALPYAKSLGVSMDTYGKGLALTYGISLCLSFFIGWMADKFHPLRTTMFAVGCYLLISIWGHCYAETKTTFLTAWVLHGVLSGACFTSMATLGQRLFPHEKFAQYSSAITFINSPITIGLAPLIGLIVDRSDNDYRYTFTSGTVFASLALFVGFLVYRKFMEYGGPREYASPE